MFPTPFTFRSSRESVSLTIELGIRKNCRDNLSFFYGQEFVFCRNTALNMVSKLHFSMLRCRYITKLLRTQLYFNAIL